MDAEGKRTIQDLQQMQAAPLGVKVGMTIERIRNWVDEYGEDGVCISFSGGKDSAVLMDIARKIYPSMKAAFVDTGLEYPEIREWVKQTDNVEWIKPKKTFKQVILKYGYPMISKEVSEVVYGAKKHIGGGGKWKDQCFDKLYGKGRYNKEISGLLRLPDGGERIPEAGQLSVRDECFNGLRQLSEAGGGIEDKPESVEITEKVPYRVKELMGWLTKDKKTIVGHIPEKDYSQFNLERYQFFLEDGAPPISNMCCGVMKKSPIHSYQKKSGLMPITAQMASESRLRTQQWLNNGCNGFNMKNPISNPMAFWTEQDILLYIYQNHLPICSVYGEVVEDFASQGVPEGQMDLSDYGLFDKERPCLKTTGCQRTGCVFCGFGCHLEKSPNRFERLAVTHPQLCDYVMRGGAFDEGGQWRPDNRGLGYWYCIEWINVHGGFHIKIPNREHYLNTYSTDETKKYLEGG